jgi:hypothetical protein
MGISVIGGATSGGSTQPLKVALEIGTTGNKTFTLESEMPAGNYTATNTAGTTVFDIYLVDSSGASAGYTSSNKLNATKPFTQVVIFGATNNSVYTLERFESETPETTGDVVAAGPFAISASPLFLPNVNDAITVTGGNFATNVQVAFRGTNNVEYAAKSVTRTSSTSLSAIRPDTFDPAFAPYDLIVSNPGITNPTATNSHILSNTIGVNSVDVNYLVIAGGASGGTSTQPGGGGGGAGGYITSITGELSGGNTAASPMLQLLPGTTYNVTIGAGGAGISSGGAGTSFGTGNNGSASSFHTISTVGGGGGAGGSVSGVANLGNSGGSGGGDSHWNGTSGVTTNGGAGTAGQGFAGGGLANNLSGDRAGGGGGGAGAAAARVTSGGVSTAGGIGLLSTITGTSIRRGGGGGGGGNPTPGAGGDGGGARGGFSEGLPGADANTGGGGGGQTSAGTANRVSGNGGSGVVILRYQNTFTISTVGLTATTATNGSFKITTITAGTGTVSWA